MRRSAMLVAMTAVLLAAGAATAAGTAFAAKENVLVYARATNGSEGATAANALRSLGYTVTLTTALPAKLSVYSSVWSIRAYEGFSSEEESALESYVSGGGRLYLTGERPCCEALDLSDQEIARAVLKNKEIVVGQQGDIPGSLTFNPQAKDSITKAPNELTTFLASEPGGIAGIGSLTGPNVLASNGTTAVGAVFDEHDMSDGKGRLVIYMDIDWLAGAGGGGVIIDARPDRRTGARPGAAVGGGGGGETPPGSARLQEIENIQDFLEKSTARTPPPSAEYVGLGDSYASGLGSFSYLSGTTGKNGCYRASNGYIENLSFLYALSLDFAACAGATIDNLWEGAKAQLKQVGPLTRYATLSIGGNDVGFASVLQSCIGGLVSTGGKGCAARDTPAAETALGWLRYGREPGKYELPGGKASDKNAARLPSLEELYEAILEQAPGIHLVVVGYPKLFETGQLEFQDCQVGTAAGLDKLTIAAGDVEWIDHETDLLDELIEQSVDGARSATGGYIEFADPRTAFTGHGLCDSETALINPLLFEGVIPHPKPKPESFHPTAEGQLELLSVIEATGAF